MSQSTFVSSSNNNADPENEITKQVSKFIIRAAPKSAIKKTYNVAKFETPKILEWEKYPKPIKMAKDEKIIQRKFPNIDNLKSKKKKRNAVENYLIHKDTKKIETTWHIEDAEGKHAFYGTLESGQKSNYVIFLRKKNEFQVFPISDWYSFHPKKEKRIDGAYEVEERLSMDKESKLQKNLQSRFNIGAKEEYKEGEEGKKKKGASAVKESGGDESGGEEDGGGFSLLDDWDVDFVPTVDDDEEALIPEDEEVEKEEKEKEQEQKIPKKELNEEGKQVKKLIRKQNKEEKLSDQSDNESSSDESSEESEETPNDVENIQTTSKKTQKRKLEDQPQEPNKKQKIEEPKRQTTITPSITSSNPQYQEVFTFLLSVGKVTPKILISKFRSIIKKDNSKFNEYIGTICNVEKIGSEDYFVLKDEFKKLKS